MSESASIPVYIRCSDEAYERLFRRQTGRDGVHASRHDRMNAILGEFCDAVEAEPGITLLSPRGEPENFRSRRFRLEPGVKARIDRIAAATPVSTEVLVREAIYRRVNTL